LRASGAPSLRLDASTVHDKTDQQTKRVGGNVALAPFDPFFGSIAHFYSAVDKRAEIARAIVMNGMNRGTIRGCAAFPNDRIDLVVKDYPLDLFNDPLPIEAQPDTVGTGHPVGARNAFKLMSVRVSPVVEGRFDYDPYLHGSPSQGAYLSTAQITDDGPHVVSTPRRPLSAYCLCSIYAKVAFLKKIQRQQFVVRPFYAAPSR
jgi:hypothetical protein